MADDSKTERVVAVKSEQQLESKTNNNKQHKNFTKRRLAPKLNSERNKGHIFVTNKIHFKQQLLYCEDILNKENEIELHCVGRTISRGMNLALVLIKNSGGTLAYEANTSTVELLDDIHPLTDEDDFSTQKRMNSSLHIKIYKVAKDL